MKAGADAISVKSKVLQVKQKRATQGGSNPDMW